MHIPWSALQKCVTLGDFAEVTSGALQGQKGWVTGLTNQLVYITGWSKQEDLMGGVTSIGRGGCPCWYTWQCPQGKYTAKLWTDH